MINNVARVSPSENLRMLPLKTVTTSVQVSAMKASRITRNNRVQCCYPNGTHLFQIIRMATAAGSFLEKTVPPQARVFFEANPQDHLEVHTGSSITSILTDRIPCEQLACLQSCSARVWHFPFQRRAYDSCMLLYLT